jgi:hypothetical protein
MFGKVNWRRRGDSKKLASIFSQDKGTHDIRHVMGTMQGLCNTEADPGPGQYASATQHLLDVHSSLRNKGSSGVFHKHIQQTPKGFFMLWKNFF